MKSAPCDRLGWHRYYAKRFNKTKHPHTEWLAIWYLLLHLGLDEEKQCASPQ